MVVIEVGRTYVNKGAGRTQRTVVGIGDEHRPTVWYSGSTPPDEPGVLYVDNRGREGQLYLCSFQSWAGADQS